MSYGFRIPNLLIIFTVENKTRTPKVKEDGKDIQSRRLCSI